MARAKKPLPSLDWLQPRLKLSRALSLLSFFALLALLLVWNLAFADLHGARIGVVLAIQLLPLALLAPGLLLGNARTHAWACFVVNLYFIQGVLAAIDPARAVFGALEAVISLGLFCSALLYTRWRFQYDRKLAGE
ncbi:DUF2069 domain-containing protein [Pseudomonas sp. AOB-7]|uniref:DUF2069 domain-containing protein n=1 Tax=unclassified Pseudomonas TaxID=196821 RepID=UPI000EFC6BDD|nr:DUF2069 domain-containing protein [Pseudomonas sp. AOB-7]RMH85036.1 DUF2069 domain-containing protein [Pseudomonas sp. AOB-7]